MTDWTAIPEEVRKELVERLDAICDHIKKGGHVSALAYLADLRAYLDPPPLSDAEKLEAIRKAMDGPNDPALYYDVLRDIRAILEGRRP
jgi:hypothetical protein